MNREDMVARAGAVIAAAKRDAGFDGGFDSFDLAARVLDAVLPVIAGRHDVVSAAARLRFALARAAASFDEARPAGAPDPHGLRHVGGYAYLREACRMLLAELEAAP